MRKRTAVQKVAMENDYHPAIRQWVKKHKPTELEMLSLAYEDMGYSISHLKGRV